MQITDEDERTKISNLLNQIICLPIENAVTSGMATDTLSTSMLK